MEKEKSSVAMRLIKEFKKQIRVLIILNAIMTIGFMVSIYDSIKIRTDQANDNRVQIIETIKSVCGD